MKQLTLLTLFIIFITLPSSATSDENMSPPPWRLSALFGLALTPTYLGDDDSQLTLLPDVRVEYGDKFSASLLTGVKYNLISTSHWQAGPIIRYDFGRDELEGNPLSLAGDETNDLLGLGDIDGSIEVGGYLIYQIGRWRAKVEARQGISGGHEGLLNELEIKYTNSFNILGKPMFYSIGPELVYGDQSYIQAYFGITEEHATNTNLATNNASSGLVAYGIHANIALPINEKWTVGAFAGFNGLGGEAKKSPLVIERGSDTQASAGFFFTYQF